MSVVGVVSVGCYWVSKCSYQSVRSGVDARPVFCRYRLTAQGYDQGEDEFRHFRNSPTAASDDGECRGHHEGLESPEPLVDVIEFVLERLIANGTIHARVLRVSHLCPLARLRVVGFDLGDLRLPRLKPKSLFNVLDLELSVNVMGRTSFVSSGRSCSHCGRRVDVHRFVVV